MKYFIYSVLFVSLVFASCESQTSSNQKTSDATNTFTVWPDSVKLKSEPLTNISNHVSFPISVNTTGNYLVFTENTDSAIVRIFSLIDDSYIGSFGRSGQGPGEFVAISAVIQDDIKKEPYLTIYDWGKKLITKYNIQDFEDQHTEWEPIKQYVLPPDIIMTHQAIFSPTDSAIFGFGGIEDGKLIKYSIKYDSLLSKSPFLPKIQYDNEKYQIGKLYRGNMGLNPVKKRLVVASRIFTQIEIYDYNLNLINASRFGKDINVNTKEPNNRMEILPSGSTVLKYTDLDFTEDRIFVYYENRTLDEMNQGICNNSEIHEYNWEGKPVTNYKLEDCPNFISYDHINKRFISINLFSDPDDDETSTIREYKLDVL